MGFLDKVKELFSGVKEEGKLQDNPVAETAGDQDHSDPDVFRGEDAEAPVEGGNE